jgi:hypothetical protein
MLDNPSLAGLVCCNRLQQLIFEVSFWRFSVRHSLKNSFEHTLAGIACEGVQPLSIRSLWIANTHSNATAFEQITNGLASPEPRQLQFAAKLMF